MRKVAVAAMAYLTLSGCGDGSSSGSVNVVSGGPTSTTPTPTPTATPSPIATPTPSTSPTSTVSLILPSEGALVTSATMDFVLTGDEVANKTADWVTTQPTPSFALAYDTTTSTFRLSDDQRTRAFDPSQIFSDSTYRDGLPSRQYNQNTLSTADFLVIFKGPLANVPAVIPKYSAYGAWQHNEKATQTHIRLDYYVYGSPTPVLAMPRTGKTIFRVIGSGNHTDAGGLFFTQTNDLYTVDWAAGTITANVLVSGSDFLRDSSGGVNAFAVNGVISGNASAGSLTYVGAPDRPGTFRIQFYGPNADEMAIIYTTTNQYSGEVGAAIGTRQ